MFTSLPYDIIVYNILIPFIINSAPTFNGALQSTLHLRATNRYFQKLVTDAVINNALIDKVERLNKVTTKEEAQKMLIAISNNESLLTENKKNWRYMNYVVTNFLIEKGAEVNVITNTDTLCDSPLIMAIERHTKPYFVEALLAYGADPNQTNKYKSTPLMIAKAKDKHDTFNILLTYGADATAKDIFGWQLGNSFYTPEGYISSELEEDLATIPYSLEDKITAIMKTIKTADDAQKKLWHIAQNNNLVDHESEASKKLRDKNLRNMNKLINFLIEKGAEINTGTTPNNSPLLRAVKYQNNTYLVEALLAHGANPDQRNKDGATPLMLAKAQEKVDIYKTLLVHKADINARDKYGLNVNSAYYSPKHYGCSLEKLAEIDNDITTMLNTVTTAQDAQEILLNVAENKNDLVSLLTKDSKHFLYMNRLVNFLIKKGAKIDTGTTANNSPLSIALEHLSHPYFVEALLAHGANPDHKNKHGSTLLMLAKAKGEPGLYGTLLGYRANIHEKDSLGWSIEHSYYTPGGYIDLEEDVATI